MVHFDRGILGLVQLHFVLPCFSLRLDRFSQRVSSSNLTVFGVFFRFFCHSDFVGRFTWSHLEEGQFVNYLISAVRTSFNPFNNLGMYSLRLDDFPTLSITEQVFF